MKTSEIVILSRFLLAVIFVSCLNASGQEWKNRLNKPENTFFYNQLNLHMGYDSNEPGDGWGIADRGARTQVSFEWFIKDKKHMQRNYTPFISPSAWNFKFSLELNPDEVDANDGSLNLRLQDTWVKLNTKWDRTSLWLGHRSYPYGHNPKLDPDLSFMPNQSGSDLGFGKDTGLFLKTPISEKLDLELSATAGGYLSGNPFVLRYTNDGNSEFEEDLDYNGSWLVTNRIGSPTFKVNEFGVFALGGKLHNNDESLITTWRVGGDWVHKHRETWKAVNQISMGENEGNSSGRWAIYNLLNSAEWFINKKFRLGVTHTLRYEDIRIKNDYPATGTVLAMISYAITRDMRLRVNPFTEYLNSTDSRDSGVLLQFCVGCGLRK